MPMEFYPRPYPHIPILPGEKRIIRRVDMNVDYPWRITGKADPFVSFELQGSDGTWHRTYHSPSLTDGAQSDWTVVHVDTSSILQGSVFSVRIQHCCSVHFADLASRTFLRFELHRELVMAILVPRTGSSGPRLVLP